MLEITEVQVTLPKQESNPKLKAYANIIFNNVFIVKGLRIIEGSKGFFVVMPNTKKSDGSFQDTAHPLNNELRKVIEDRVMEEYEARLNHARSSSQS